MIEKYNGFIGDFVNIRSKKQSSRQPKVEDPNQAREEKVEKKTVDLMWVNTRENMYDSSIDNTLLGIVNETLTLVDGDNGNGRRGKDFSSRYSEFDEKIKVYGYIKFYESYRYFRYRESEKPKLWKMVEVSLSHLQSKDEVDSVRQARKIKKKLQDKRTNVNNISNLEKVLELNMEKLVLKDNSRLEKSKKIREVLGENTERYDEIKDVEIKHLSVFVQSLLSFKFDLRLELISNDDPSRISRFERMQLEEIEKNALRLKQEISKVENDETKQEILVRLELELDKWKSCLNFENSTSSESGKCVSLSKNKKLGEVSFLNEVKDETDNLILEILQKSLSLKINGNEKVTTGEKLVQIVGFLLKKENANIN